jgi:hypothetical protein
MNDNYEELGMLIDDIESLSFALQLNMPAEFHVQQLKKALPEKVQKMKDVFVKITGENPWE